MTERAERGNAGSSAGRGGAVGSSRPKDRVAHIQSSASRLEAGTGGKLATASRERSKFETRIGGMPEKGESFDPLAWLAIRSAMDGARGRG